MRSTPNGEGSTDIAGIKAVQECRVTQSDRLPRLVQSAMRRGSSLHKTLVTHAKELSGSLISLNHWTGSGY